MTVLDEVAAYLPPTRVPVEEICDRVGAAPGQARLLRRFHGLDQVLRAPDEGPADLLALAAGRLRRLRGRADRVRYVVHARTMHAVAPYPISLVQQVCGRLGLEHAAAFTVTQHSCASGLLAIALAGELLADTDDGSALALVLTGEKAFTASAEMVPGAAVTGECAAACLVRAAGPGDRLLGYASHTRGRYHDIMRLPPELGAGFQRDYVPEVARVLHAAADRAGLALQEIALILPHNVNRSSWLRLCQLTGYPADRVFLRNVSRTGHCFCADPFVNYRSACDLGLLQPGDRYLMASVGLGATFAAMVFERQENGT
jgi:3-oxoacyl-[acyl-carrier-protein] synthase III